MSCIRTWSPEQSSLPSRVQVFGGNAMNSWDVMENDAGQKGLNASGDGVGLRFFPIVCPTKNIEALEWHLKTEFLKRKSAS